MTQSEGGTEVERQRDDIGTFDVIVVGAGINGAGIARDAALRGLRVLLVDKGDVASGTTSWSTRLIHGGLRYLEHAEIGLVRESLRERERLFRIAPHLVQPLPLLIPLYRGDKRGPLVVRAGMLAYDALSLGKSLPRHRMLDRAAVQRRIPGLRAEGLRGAALYYDGQVEFAERLALENALDARRHGAMVRTYHRIDRIVTHDNRVSGVEGWNVLRDRPFRAEAPVIVNAGGPWVDDVLAETGYRDLERLIGGTKGSHIVVSPFRGAPREAIYAESRRDRRPFFIIPWNEAYLIGTTDIRYDGCLDWVTADDWEIDWLLEETNWILPQAKLSRADVRYSYAGVRPLPYAPEKVEGSVTRRHAVIAHAAQGGPRGLYSIVGGKLTTFRELAEQAVDQIMRESGRTVTPSRTAELPLPGGSATEPWPVFCADFFRRAGLPRKSADHLLRVYGARAPQVLKLATTAELKAPFDAATGAIAAEIPWAFQEEEAQTLADALLRRTMVGLGPDTGVAADMAAAAIARQILGWSAERAEEEVATYRQVLRRYRPLALDAASSA